MTDVELLNSLRGENILEGSYLLRYIEDLAKSLSYASDGTAISYDDMYAALSQEVEKISNLALELSVPPGGETQYSIQLTQAMESVIDDCDRVSHKVSKFESKVADALGKLKRVRGEFSAWYMVAATPKLAASGIHMVAAQVQKLAESDFSRLVNGLDIAFETLLSSVKLLRAEIKQHKKTQMDKYNMGKDQVNAAWTSHMPVFNGSGDITNERPGRLLKPRDHLDEAAEEEPDFEPEEIGSPPDKEWAFQKFGDPRPAHPVLSDGYGDS